MLNLDYRIKKIEAAAQKRGCHSEETIKNLLVRLGFNFSDDEIESDRSFLELMTNQEPGLKVWQR